jgi:hypothetical protein
LTEDEIGRCGGDRGGLGVGGAEIGELTEGLGGPGEEPDKVAFLGFGAVD